MDSFFPFLRWTVVPTARLPPVLSSGLPASHSEVELFRVPHPTQPLWLLPGNLTVVCASSLSLEPRKTAELLQMSFWPCSRNLALHGGKEGVGCPLEGWSPAALAVYAGSSSLYPDGSYSRSVFWWGRDFCFLLENGKCDFFPIPVAILEKEG